jgi:putative endonuclease
MTQHLELGRKGEALAKAHLENSGYEILDENWTHRRLEVDLIAYKNKTIIFVEVKARSGTGFGQPEDFVDMRKQRLLADAAGEYLYLMNHQGEVRFDIISVLFDRQNNHVLKHIEDAFWPTAT